jgi:hypothetical protein
MSALGGRDAGEDELTAGVRVVGGCSADAAEGAEAEGNQGEQVFALPTRCTKTPIDSTQFIGESGAIFAVWQCHGIRRGA